MPESLPRSLAGAAAVTLLLTAASEARPLVVPFDFSRNEIGLDVRVRGAPLYMFLDTGVTPSAIDTARAKSVGLKIDFSNGGEASGAGDAAHVLVYPTTIDDLTIAGHRFGSVETLAADHKTISRAYGRTVDGTLGHSFLAGKIVLIDYGAKTVAISDRESDMASHVAACRKVLRRPLRSFKGDIIPIVDLSIGDASLLASIDTGSNSVVELFKRALDKPAIKAALVAAGTTKQTGARGGFTAKVYKLNAPISLGPFVLSAGQRVTVRGEAGSPETRLVNVGNRLLAGMNLKLLLDYRANRITFLGDCSR